MNRVWVAGTTVSVSVFVGVPVFVRVGAEACVAACIAVEAGRAAQVGGTTVGADCGAARAATHMQTAMPNTSCTITVSLQWYRKANSKMPHYTIDLTNGQS